MGESSLKMWTSMPEIIFVDHPFALTKGTNFIDISVNKNSGPVENAWVTILMESDETILFDYLLGHSKPRGSCYGYQKIITYKNSFTIFTPEVSLGLIPSYFSPLMMICLVTPLATAT